MRLSDKLATAQPREDIETPSAVDRLNRRRSPRDERPGQASWEASKRKVRELVLADMAPKMGHLSGEGLAREVRGSLDGILERSDVTISPLERRKFVQEMIQAIKPGFRRGHRFHRRNGCRVASIHYR